MHGRVKKSRLWTGGTWSGLGKAGWSTSTAADPFVRSTGRQGLGKSRIRKGQYSRHTEMNRYLHHEQVDVTRRSIDEPEIESRTRPRSDSKNRP